MSVAHSTSTSKARKARTGGKAKEIAKEMEAKRADTIPLTEKQLLESSGWEKQVKSPAPFIAVKRIAIVDDAGNIRALLGPDGFENPQLKFFDKNGDVTHEMYTLNDYHGFRATDPTTLHSVSISATNGDEEGFHEATLFISDDPLDNVVKAAVRMDGDPYIEIDTPKERGKALEIAKHSPTADFPLIRLRPFAEKLYGGVFEDDLVVFVHNGEIMYADKDHAGGVHKDKWAKLGNLPENVHAYQVETPGLPEGWADWWIGSEHAINDLKRLCEIESKACSNIYDSLASY